MSDQKTPNVHDVPLRDDELGKLARQLIGNEQAPPDLSAAIGLFDELKTHGLDHWAGDLLVAVTTCYSVLRERHDPEYLTQRFPSSNNRSDADIVRDILSNVGWLSCLIYDFSSMCLYGSARVAEPEVEVKLEQGQTEVSTVSFTVPANVDTPSLGARVRLPDGRWGVVALVKGRKIEAIPLGEDEYGQPPEGMPAAMMGGPVRSRRIGTGRGNFPQTYSG